MPSCRYHNRYILIFVVQYAYLATINGVQQVRVRVLNVDSEARKLVLSMRQKPRPPVGEQGDVSKYVAMLEEVRHEHFCNAHTHVTAVYTLLLPLPCPRNQ